MCHTCTFVILTDRQYRRCHNCYGIDVVSNLDSMSDACRLHNLNIDLLNVLKIALKYAKLDH